MKVYACGNCGGALEAKKDVSMILCMYCGYTNEHSSMEEDLARFKKDVAGWLSSLGAVGGATGVDVAMRQMYFQDSIYPNLLTEFSNLIGDTEDVLDFPLVYTRIFNRIPDLKVKTSWSPQEGKPLKEFSRKLESQGLLGFVSDPDSKWLIHELKFRAITIPMLMDVLTLAETPNSTSFIQSSNTLAKLAKEATNLAAIPSEERANLSSYFTLLSKRLLIASESFETFAETINAGKQINENWLNERLSQLREIRSDLKKIKTLSVTDRVFLEYGLDNDANAISATFSLSNLYPTITKVNFETYMDAIEKLADQTLFMVPPDTSDHLSWFRFGMDSEKLSWFLTALQSTFSRKFYSILTPPTAIGPWIKKQRDVKAFFLYPFYLSRVFTVLKSGFLLWKKGAEEQFYSLCDAAFNLSPKFQENDYPIFMTPGFKKMVGSKREQVLHSLMEQDGKPKPAKWIALPPTVTPSDVRFLYTSAHNYLEEADLAATQGKVISIPSSYKKMGFDSGKVKSLSTEVLQLVYLPLAVTGTGVNLLGNHLGLECKSIHRRELCRAFTIFMSTIGAHS